MTPDGAHGESQVARRTIIGAALWTAPAIVVVSAAPAFAASDLANPPIVSFAAQAVPGSEGEAETLATYFDLEIQQLTLRAPAGAEAVQAMVSVSFVPSGTDVVPSDSEENLDHLLFIMGGPEGWGDLSQLYSEDSSAAAVAIWQSQALLSAGDEVSFPGGTYVGTNSFNVVGEFVITAAFGAEAGAEERVPTGPLPAAMMRMGAGAQGRLNSSRS